MRLHPGQPELGVSLRNSERCSHRGLRCHAEGPRAGIPGQPTFFRAAVIFTATYSNKYYMEGTRDVEAKVEIIAQLDDNDVLILDKDGKPEFTVDFTR